MPRQRLTLPRIAAFKPKSEGFLWDEDAPQLAVRVRASRARDRRRQNRRDQTYDRQRADGFEQRETVLLERPVNRRS